MRRDVAATIEATRLGPGLLRETIETLCADARRLDVAGVCVPGIHVPRARDLLAGSGVVTVSVAAFPFGDATPEAVVHEIHALAQVGAQEVDVVAPLGLALSGKWEEYQQVLSLCGLAARTRNVRLKVILETAALNRTALDRAASAALQAGADWLKTSTGFHPSGGASVDAVARLREIVAGTECGVKASGGIRSPEQALAMIEAGADRIGTSSEARILGEAG